MLGHVPDAVLEALYERALAVSCVSREEGFGFTPLEALARGTPAVVTDLPVFDETVGAGALRVPPATPPRSRTPCCGSSESPSCASAWRRAGSEAARAAVAGSDTARSHGAAFAEARRVSAPFAIVTVIHDSEPELPTCSTPSRGFPSRGRG